MIFLLSSNSLFFISNSKFGCFTSTLGIFISGPLSFPSIPTFILGFFKSFFPNITPVILNSFLPLIFKSGDFTLGSFPSILIFGPLIFPFPNFGTSTFGPLTFKSPPFTSNLGRLISNPGISPFIS